VDFNLIYHNRIIYNTGERYNLHKVDADVIGKIMEAKAGENKIIYLNNNHILSDQGEFNCFW